MALAGRGGKIKVSTTDASYNEVLGIQDISYEVGYESADISRMGDTAKRQLPTISTFSGSASGVYEPTDSTGQAVVKTAMQSRTTLWVQVLVDGTNGYKAECILKPSKYGAKQGADAVSFAFDFEAGGGLAPVVVP